MAFVPVTSAIQALPKFLPTGQPYLSMVDSCLRYLCHIGFDRVRFYAVADDPHRPPPGESLFLVALSDNHEIAVDAGYAISLQSSTYGILGAGTWAPCIESDFGSFEGSTKHEWLEPLGLKGRSWADIPVHDGGKLLGLFSADWVGPPEHLRHNTLLSVYGRVVGSLLLNAPHELSLAISDGLSRLVGSASGEPDDIAKSVLDLLSSALQSGTAALFKYIPTLNALERIKVVNADGESWDDVERYEVGQYLTGRAWREDGAAFRQVVNFDSIQTNFPDLVSPSSLEWHEAHGGPVRSVAYLKLGESEPRYLIRLVNKAADPRLPFISEFTALREAASELGLLVDNVIAESRASASARLSPYLADQRSTDEIVDSLLKALSESEGFSSAIVLLDRGHTTGFEIAASIGLSLSSSELWQEITRDDPLYTTCALAKEVSLYSLTRSLRPDPEQPRRRAPSFRSTSRLAQVLHADGHRSALGVPVLCGGTRGAIVVPTAYAGLELSPRVLVSEGGQQALRQYATILATTAESAYLAQQGTEAMRALGLVGHELAIPVSTLSSMGEDALVNARAVLRELRQQVTAGEPVENAARRADWYLRSALERYDDVRGQVTSALSLASVVSRDGGGYGGGYLNCDPSSVSVQAIVNRAVRQARTENDPEGFLSCEFSVSGDIRGLGQVICDHSYVHHCLLNVLRNAVKYSEPRRPGQRPVIEIFGAWSSSDGSLEIDVRNWGMEIPQERRGVIFEAFVRGGFEAPELAKRGMGLGLFLARRIAVAHGGEVRLHRHRLVESNIFDTIFRVSIPGDLAEVPYTFVFGTSDASGQVPRVAR